MFTEAERVLVMKHVEGLLSLPTAPYAEDGPIAYVREFVRARPELRLVSDEYQNLLVTYRGTARGGRAPGKRPKLAFSAHLDHPGFLYVGKRGGRHTATFHGGVPDRFFKGAPVRFFDLASGRDRATATVKATRRTKKGILTAELARVKGTLRSGDFGMWDLTPGAIRGKRLNARVCDDLLGASAMLALFDLLIGRAHETSVLGIFTRAEETGFIGCQGLLRTRVLRGDVRVIGLECSPRRATAKVGKGPVIRVGDRATVFDPALTHLMQAAAAALQARAPKSLFQRALMDGGRCESSAYNLWGVPAGGLCLALGNYHNCGKDGVISPEFVDWDDHEGMVALMLETTALWDRELGADSMRGALDRIWQRELERLEKSATRLVDSKSAR